jgi:hypothetical protein
VHVRSARRRTWPSRFAGHWASRVSDDRGVARVLGDADPADRLLPIVEEYVCSHFGPLPSAPPPRPADPGWRRCRRRYRPSPRPRQRRAQSGPVRCTPPEREDRRARAGGPGPRRRARPGLPRQDTRHEGERIPAARVRSIVTLPPACSRPARSRLRSSCSLAIASKSARLIGSTRRRPRRSFPDDPVAEDADGVGRTSTTSPTFRNSEVSGIALRRVGRAAGPLPPLTMSPGGG